MCKINLLLGVNDNKKALNMAIYIERAMSETQPHGFGYAACDNEGKLFSEKWLCNPNAWYSFKKNLPFYNCKGVKNFKNVTSLITHARYATSEKNIANTHPFERDNTYLIHNGVVLKHGLEYLSSTCDSEGILNAYVKSNIYTRPDDIQKVISKLDGWFACTVMTNKYVDVFKESQSQLYFCKSKEINYIYCTSEHILNMALKRYDIDHTKVNAVPCNTLLRHNVMTGDIISSYKFEVNERKKYVFDDDKTWYKNYKKSVKYLELFK